MGMHVALTPALLLLATAATDVHAQQRPAAGAPKPGWALLFRQTAGTFLPPADWVHYNAGADRATADFSVLDELEQYRQADGFTLKMVWPDREGANTQVWRQTSNPVTETVAHGGVTGYEPIDVSFTSRGWGGLEHGGENSLLDGSAESSAYFYAVGTNGAWQCGIPGPNDCEERVELYALFGRHLTPAPTPLPPPGPPPAPGWSCLFRQSAGNYRSAEDWIRYDADADRTSADFSILDELERWRDADTRVLTLKLVWPDRPGANSQVWKQISNPVTSSAGGVEGYQAVNVSFNTHGWGGLERGNDNALLDGSVDSGAFFYAVGTSGEWSCGIPGANDCESKVELWADFGEQLPVEPPPPPPVYQHATGWTCLFRQRTGNYMPASEWVRYNAGDRSGDFSVLDELEQFRYEDGTFTLKLVWPDRADGAGQVWKQSSNPVTSSSGGVEGYEAIDISFTGQGWGGLERNLDGGDSPNSLLDGSVDAPQWFYAVGSSGAWNCGIPGPTDCEEAVELYALWGLEEAPAPPPPDFVWRKMLRQVVRIPRPSHSPISQRVLPTRNF